MFQIQHIAKQNKKQFKFVDQDKCKFYDGTNLVQIINVNTEIVKEDTKDKYPKFGRVFKHGVNCQFKHQEHKDDSDETVRRLKGTVDEKDGEILELKNLIKVLQEETKNNDKMKYDLGKLDNSLKSARKENEKKDAQIKVKDEKLMELKVKGISDEKAIKELDKNLADTNYELKQQVKKNEILHKLLKQKDEDVKKDEESKESETNKVDEGSRELTSFSCDICSFSGNSKSALTKQKRISIEKRNKWIAQQQICKRAMMLRMMTLQTR